MFSMEVVEKSETNFMLNRFFCRCYGFTGNQMKVSEDTCIVMFPNKCECYHNLIFLVIIPQIFLWSEFMGDLIECTVTTITSFKFNLSPFLLSFCHVQNKKLQSMHPLVSLYLSAHLVAYNDSRTVQGVVMKFDIEDFYCCLCTLSKIG